VIALCSGCGKKPGSPTPAADQSVARGDRVVIEQTAATFFEGRVLAVDGQRLRVQKADEGDPLTVESSDAYRLPPPARDHRAGELAICSTGGTRWIGCRLEQQNGGAWRARGSAGETFEVDAPRLLSPTPVTELNLRRHFDRAEQRERFARDAERAGQPRAPSGWRPQARRRVVARHGSGWFSATVHEIEDERLHVIFVSDARTAELAYGDVVPEPPYARPLRTGDFALLRPEAVAQAWQPVRIERATPAGFRVADIGGATREVQNTDLLPLVADGAQL